MPEYGKQQWIGDTVPLLFGMYMFIKGAKIRQKQCCVSPQWLVQGSKRDYTKEFRLIHSGYSAGYSVHFGAACINFQRK